MTSNQIKKPHICFININGNWVRSDSIIALFNFNNTSKVYGMFNKSGYDYYNQKIKITEEMLEIFNTDEFLKISSDSYLRYDAITEFIDEGLECCIMFTAASDIICGISHISKAYIRDNIYKRFHLKI